MSFSVYLIGLSKSVWQSWPEERSLAELAQDAFVLRRLIEPGIDFYRKQLNYIQICDRIHSLSMQRMKMDKDCYCLNFSQQEANNYILLVKKLQDSHPSGIFFEPGANVADQLNILEQIQEKIEYRNKELITIFQKKYNFYQQANQQDKAVVELITFN